MSVTSPRTIPALRRELLLADLIHEALTGLAETLSGTDREQFLANDVLHSAVQLELARIGRAAERMPAYARARFASVAWDDYAAYGDQLLTRYYAVDLEQVWRRAHAAACDLPSVVAAIHATELPSGELLHVGVPRVPIPKARLDELCRAFQVRELALFGSVLRDDFHPDSDIDILVEFDPVARFGLSRFFELQRELEDLFGREVDLIEQAGLKPRLRDDILASREIIYSVETA